MLVILVHFFACSCLRIALQNKAHHHQLVHRVRASVAVIRCLLRYADNDARSVSSENALTRTAVSLCSHCSRRVGILVRNRALINGTRPSRNLRLAAPRVYRLREPQSCYACHRRPHCELASVSAVLCFPKALRFAVDMIFCLIMQILQELSASP